MEKDKVIEMLDSVVGALSLNITNPKDVIKFEETYSVLRQTMREALKADEKRLVERRNYIGGVPVDYEPTRRNRFLLTFPEAFNLPPWLVSTVELPIMSRNTFGNNERINWSNLVVTYYNLIAPSTARIIFDTLENQRNFNIHFSLLDPTGETCQELTIDVNHVSSIDLGNFSQNNDGMHEITVCFAINHMICNY